MSSVKAILVAALVVIISKQVWSASLRMGNSTSATPQNDNPPERTVEEVQPVDEPDKAKSSAEGEPPNEEIYNGPYTDGQTLSRSSEEYGDGYDITRTINFDDNIYNEEYGDGEIIGGKDDDSKEVALPKIIRQKRSTQPHLAAIVTKVIPRKGKDW